MAYQFRMLNSLFKKEKEPFSLEVIQEKTRKKAEQKTQRMVANTIKTLQRKITKASKQGKNHITACVEIASNKEVIRAVERWFTIAGFYIVYEKDYGYDSFIVKW